MATGAIEFNAVDNTTYAEAAAYLHTNLSAGFKITSRFTMSSVAVASARILNIWGTTTAERAFTFHVRSDANIRFSVVDVSGATFQIQSAGVPIIRDSPHLAVMEFIPGQPLELTVDGTPFVGNNAVDDIRVTSPNPMRAGVDSESSEASFFAGISHELLLEVTTGIDARLSSVDSGVGALGGTQWADSFGTVWDGVGALVGQGESIGPGFGLLGKREFTKIRSTGEFFTK